MGTDRVSIFGDSIFKGVQLDESSGRYAVEDSALGFEEIAARAGFRLENFSKFGCTITKAWDYLGKMTDRMDADLVFMDFGGNDCDFSWSEIAARPMDVHRPRTGFYDFIQTYNDMVDSLKEKRCLPVVSTLVPIQGEWYIDYQCRTKGLDKADIMKWLGDYDRVEHFQLAYSDAVKGVASSRDIPLIDIRAAFESCGDTKQLMCNDGIHPNSKGQKVIHDCFEAFMMDFLAW